MTWWQKLIAWISSAVVAICAVIIAALEIYTRGRRDGQALERGRQAEAANKAIAEVHRQEARDRAAAEQRARAAEAQIQEINRSEIEDERKEPKTPVPALTEAQLSIQRAIAAELEDPKWKP